MRLWPVLLFALFSAGFLIIAPAAAQDAAPGATAAPPAATNQPAAPAPEGTTTEPAPRVGAPSIDELISPINALQNAIEAAEKNLDRTPGSQRDLATLRTGIEKVEVNAKSAAERLQPRLDEVRSQIAKLGPSPGPEDPPESDEVAEERKRLNAVAAQIDGAIKKAALIEVRARQLVSRVQHVRQGVFTRFLFRQTDTPLQWRVWRQAGEQLHLAQRQVGFILSNWWATAALNLTGLLTVLGGALAGYLGLRYLTRRLMHARLDCAGPPTPTSAQRAANAAWVAPALALPVAIAVLIVYVGLDELGLLYWQVERFAQSALYPLFVAISVSALTRALLQPSRPRWRLFDLDDASARTVSFAVQAIALVYALDFLGRRIVSILSLPLSTSIVTAFIASLLYAILLTLIVRTPVRPRAMSPDAPVSRWSPVWPKGLLLALAVILVTVSMLGYVALGRFIVEQLLTTGAALILVGVLHMAIRAVVPDPAASTEQTGGMSRLIQQRFKLDEFGRNQLTRTLRILLNILLFIVAAPLLLMALGMTFAEIMSWVRAAVFGFDVGGVRVSLARILAAALLFVVLLGLTRFVQRWLASGTLARGRMEPGLANSIYTGTGYVGFAIATLAAIAYVGLDITSLAIVAGALSVGIGFGLQSIVNNFVSGLILLVERPIKVGDRVTVNGQDGFVRRISVRSTEIETFDRSSLIVPNSEFITTTVTNWTHRNTLGRALVTVSTSYSANADQVIDILLKVAEECPLVQKHPPPAAAFDNFGADGLDFILIAVVSDINKVGDVRSDLRVRILKAFREAGIVFAVEDKRLRELDRARTIAPLGPAAAEGDA